MFRRPQTVEKAQRKLGFFYKIIETLQPLMNLTSLNVSDLKNTPWPEDLKEILEYYLIKPTGTADCNNEQYVQLSLVDDADIVNVD